MGTDELTAFVCDALWECDADEYTWDEHTAGAVNVVTKALRSPEGRAVVARALGQFVLNEDEVWLVRDAVAAYADHIIDHREDTEDEYVWAMLSRRLDAYTERTGDGDEH